jgi:hypothetical protein
MMRRLTGLVCGTLAAWPLGAAGISGTGPADGAPAALAQYGQFIGVWQCRTYARVRDGSWQANDWEATWTWRWVLEGHAIQDVWEVPPEAPRGHSLGTNLRIYDPESDVWRIAWTTTVTREFDLFEARAQGADVVMTGEIPARGQRPPHTARVTFHDIAADSFQWRYEASLQGGDGPYSEQARLTCRRAGG